MFGIIVELNILGQTQGIHLRERHPVGNKTVCLMTVPDPENNPEPEGDVDPFEELGVEPTPTGAKISDGLDAFMDDGDEEEVEIETKVEHIELSEEEDDDEDLFAALGVAGPAVALSSSGEEDILSAFMDDDEDEDEELTEPEATSPEPTPKPQANAKESYRMVLETVWVDGILDPGEVNLLARRREELGLTFEEHLEMVREMLG